MKRLALVLMALAFAGAAQAQSVGDLLKGVGRASAASSLTQRDAVAGLKEALQASASAATARLGRSDGFFGDPRVRIPLPGTLGRTQRSLKAVGLSAPLDDLELRVNRGAEAAMPQARSIFVSAIRSMTIEDAVGIVRGGDDAGAQFLRAKAGAQISALLRPHMETALQRSGAFAALDTASARAGLSGAAQTFRTDLIEFAVGKALDGAFGYIAEEERAIRRDPARRTTALLRRVFGG